MRALQSTKKVLCVCCACMSLCRNGDFVFVLRIRVGFVGVAYLTLKFNPSVVVSKPSRPVIRRL